MKLNISHKNKGLWENKFEGAEEYLTLPRTLWSRATKYIWHSTDTLDTFFSSLFKLFKKYKQNQSKFKRMNRFCLVGNFYNNSSNPQKLFDSKFE